MAEFHDPVAGAVQRYAMGLFGVQLGSDYMASVKAQIASSNAVGVLNQVADVFNAYYTLSFGGASHAAIANNLLANLGVQEGQSGLTAADIDVARDYVLGYLDAAAVGQEGAAVFVVLSNFAALTADPIFGSAAAAWNATALAADQYAVNHAGNADIGTVVTAFNLAVGNDNITGTAGDDLFTSNFFSNGNTLESGDNLNGGAGLDALKAIMAITPFAITPTVSGVEHIAVTAQNDALQDSGQNNTSGLVAVQLDFGRVSGIQTIENFDSRADLVIEDVRIQDNEITKDITIEMRDTDPGAVDFAVYFDQLSLRNVSNATSLINLRVLDTYAVAQGLDPLKDSPYGSFQFSYSVNGGELQVATLASDAIQNAQTFPEMVAALQAAADELFGAGVVSVTTGSTYTVPDSVTNTNVQGTEIVMSAQGSITFDTSVPGSGWLATETVPAVSGLYTSYNTDQQSTTALVTSTIVLDNVGRGSNSGDLIVGGQSVGDTSSSKGVERFDITVQDDSKLGTIASTNNTLREVYVVNGATDRDQNAYNKYAQDAGNLTVKETAAADGNALPDASGQEQDGFGFTDLRVIDGSAMTGKFDFTAGVTQASIEKYLNKTDTANDPAADNVQFIYSGGGNNDTINVSIDSAVTASRTLTGREDFRFDVNGGAGDDSLTVDIGGTQSAAWRVDQFALRNIDVDAGAGNDTVNVVGAGAFNVNAGAGNDTVYVDNTGAKSVWVVAAENRNVNDLQSASNANGTVFLYGGTLTVTFAAGNESGLTAGLANAYNNGFEAKVDVPTGDNYAVTQYHVNQAIKAAIQNSPVLSKLLSVEDGPGTTLVITSKIDGSSVARDLDIGVEGVDLTTLGANEQTTVLAAYQKYSANSAATIAEANAAEAAAVTGVNAVTGVGTAVLAATSAGTASAQHNDSIIDAGVGADVVVLGTGAFSNDTVKFTGYDQGSVTVVNFNNGGTGADSLDFSSYLTGLRSASGSTESQQLIDRTVNTDGVVEANSISLLNFTESDADKFANLTAERLLSAINSTNTGSADFGGIGAGSLDALTSYVASGAGTTLVGGVGKAVVLVQNQSNDGEYKAFELTFNGVSASNATADFSAAQLISTIDLGADLTDATSALVTANRSSAEVVPATYDVVATAPSANEGTTATFTLNTTGVAAGTSVAYTIGGAVTAADLVGGATTGNVVVNAAGTATISVALVADLTTEGAEALTVTVGGDTAGMVVNDTSVTPVGTPLVAGTTAPVAATAAADTFTFDVAAAKALEANTQITVTGFDLAGDTLVIDTATASPAVTTLAGLAGVDGITVFANVITNETLVDFGADANGDVVAITLAGIIDPSLVNISVI